MELMILTCEFGIHPLAVLARSAEKPVHLPPAVPVIKVVVVLEGHPAELGGQLPQLVAPVGTGSNEGGSLETTFGLGGHP